MTATVEDIRRAARILAEGGVVAFPTETVYGLGADADRSDAVRRVFEIKGRPVNRPLIVHVEGLETVPAFATKFPNFARAIAEALWPGPVTLVLPARPTVAREITGGGDTVGIRAPDHPVALDLIRALGEARAGLAGIAAPSANPTGKPPPVDADEVRVGLGDAPDFVLDGGRCPVQVPSTVISCLGPGPTILRDGAISRERLQEIVGMPILDAEPAQGT